MPSYHDLYVTTPEIKRTSVFDLPFNLIVICTRSGGWELWNTNGSGQPDKWVQLGGEYSDRPLKLDVRGKVIVNSFPVDGK